MDFNLIKENSGFCLCFSLTLSKKKKRYFFFFLAESTQWRLHFFSFLPILLFCLYTYSDSVLLWQVTQQWLCVAKQVTLTVYGTNTQQRSLFRWEKKLFFFNATRLVLNNPSKRRSSSDIWQRDRVCSKCIKKRRKSDRYGKKKTHKYIYIYTARKRNKSNQVLLVKVVLNTKAP